jgi:hypothetical protein
MLDSIIIDIKREFVNEDDAAPFLEQFPLSSSNAPD